MNLSFQGRLTKEYYCYAGAYFFSYAAIGALFPLIGQYLRSIGFDGIQIGTITSAATVIGLFASPLLGKVFYQDRKTAGHKTVMMLCVAAAVVATLAIPVKGFFPFLLLYTTMAFFQVSVMPLTDTLMMRSVHSFGGTRKWGAAGFALSVLLAGRIAGEIGLYVILIIYAASFMISAMFLLIIMKQKRASSRAKTVSSSATPATPPTEPIQLKPADHSKQLLEEEPPKSTAAIKSCVQTGALTDVQTGGRNARQASHQNHYGALLRHKKYVQLLICAFFLCGTNAGNNTYFGFLYTDAGGSVAGIGTAFLLMAGSEIPFMAWFEKLTARFTLEKILFYAMTISALRFLWYGTQPPYWILLGMFFLQGAVNGIILVGFASYVSKLVPTAMLGMAMALYQALSSNLSTIFCQFIGGSLLEGYGSSAVYLFFGIYNVIGVMLYVIFKLQK